MSAEIITTGTELLLGEIVDTNAAWLSQRLAELGIDVYRRTTVGDNPERLAAACRQALEENDLVLVSGGLGPTVDDCTAEALAKALGVRLVLHEEARRQVEEWAARRGRTMREQDLKQALLPEGATPLPNRRGSAPGIFWRGEYGGRRVAVVALPGVPTELRGMFSTEVRPLLSPGAGAVIRTHVLHVVGISESEVDRRLGDLWRSPNPTVGVCARRGQLEVRLTAKAASAAEADALLGVFGERVRTALGPVVFGSGGVALAAAVGVQLRRAGWRLAVAESCTGGLIGDWLTDVPGSSDYLDRVLVAYANRAKTELLGVPPETLAAHGAVSPETARLMAEGIRRHGVDVGLAVTGIAGPGGGTAAKPVGLVYVAVAGAGGTVVRELRLGAERRSNKERAATAALALLWEYLGGGEIRPEEARLEED
ncbi:MAG: competence/damage-inducible protein A [Bacillota bacterium]|nr:competence/damage-inducible protein A [Bacillota bacterium]